MAKSNIHNKDDFNFDDFQYSGVKLTPPVDPSQALPEDSLLAEPTPLETPAVAEPVSEVASPLEAEDPQAKKKAKKEKKVKEKKVKEKKVKEKKIVPATDRAGAKSAFLSKVSEASPYTVLLGMTLVALFLAVLFLFIELNRYDLDVTANKIKKSLAMNDAVTAPFADYCSVPTLTDYRV